jgi:uncharacterized protein (TIGR02466 family)
VSEAAIVERAEALIAEGKVDEAVALTAPLAAGASPSLLALAAHAGALKQAGRHPEALALDEQAVARFANNAVAWHNYAATLDDLGRAEEAVAACERALGLGLDAPATYAVFARALAAAGQHERAAEAYRQALARAPADVRVATEYANHVWMTQGDVVAADAVLDRAFHAGAPPAPLLAAKSTLYDAAGQTERAAQLLDAASQRLADSALVQMAAADLALRLERLDDAARYIALAQAADPASRSVTQYAAILDLAQGRPGEALAKLRSALEGHPADQSLWCWAAVAARAAGDPLYGELYDYEAMVGVYDIPTPESWPNLEAFLGDLSNALKDIHSYQRHPVNQSLRHGSQSMHLLTGSSAPAIKAFFEVLDIPLRQHMQRLGQGDDPLRRRNTFDYRIKGAWSVRLQPGGFHRDHFHPEGWLSSAFYVETPEAALESEDRQGWIRFGQPPFVTNPPLPAEHYVRPKPGRLVLFPSYMWHGTVPFTTDESRMTIAFDAIPK